MVNQFYIRPTPISMQGIRGIGTGLARMQQEGRQRERLDRGRQMMKAAMANGDEEMVANVMMDFPELAESFGQAMKFKNERTKANAMVGLRQILANPERAGEVLRNRIQVVAAEGGDPTDTAMELTAYQEDPEGYINNLRMQYGGMAPKQEFEAYQKTVAGGPGGMVSAKTEIMDDGTTVQVRPSGEVVVTDPSGSPVTGQERLNVLQKARDTGILTKQREADVAVNQARRTAGAKARQERISAITKEQSDSSRSAARSRPKLESAMRLAETAEQGLTGTVKLKLAKVFPDIDVTDEAALSRSLTDLAVEQLQRMKGPSTDFEFGKMEEISGQIGDSKSANIARLNSLARANWFSKENGRQFREYVKAGGDPDYYQFDWDQKIPTAKGMMPYSDIQQTAMDHNMTIENLLKRWKQ